MKYKILSYTNSLSFKDSGYSKGHLHVTWFFKKQNTGGPEILKVAYIYRVVPAHPSPSRWALFSAVYLLLLCRVFF